MRFAASTIQLTLICLFLTAPAHAAAITLQNFGFENGLAGWTVVVDPRHGSLYTVDGGEAQGYARVVTAHSGNDPQGAITYGPTEGEHFLELNTTGGGVDAAMVGVYQTFTAERGETFSGYAAFDARVRRSLFSIVETASVSFDFDPVYFTNVPEVGGYGDEPWTKWTWEAPETGQFTIYYLLTNPKKNDHTSYAVFDAVPIPPTLLIFGSGLIGVMGLRWRKMV